MKQAAVFFAVAFMVLTIHAQGRYADSTTVILGVQGHYGWIWAHSSSLTNISGSNPWGLTAELSRIRHTQQSWDACNCISQNGISLSYFNFNNPDVLGSSLNLALFGEPVLLHGKVSVSLRGAAGLSYLTRTFHPENNPQNIFFSQPLSGLLQAQLNLRAQLSQHWQARAGISYNHISNGGMRQPNKGMNFPMLNFGIDYIINPLPMQRRQKIPVNSPSIHYYTGLFMNTRKVTDTRERRMPMVGVQLGFFKPVSLTNAIGLAMEASFDASIKKLNQLSSETYDHRIISLLFRNHFLFGRFDFSQALGVYLYHEAPGTHDLFQRYALEYRLVKNLKAGFSLKAHGHVAEQMDLRMMYVF